MSTPNTDISSALTDYELLCFIVDRNQSAKLLAGLRAHFSTGATVLLGSGSRPSKFLQILGLSEVKRDIILIVQSKSEIGQILDLATDKLNLREAGKGIAFTCPLQYFCGLDDQGQHLRFNELRSTESMLHEVRYVALHCVVDYGLGEEVVGVAEEAGAKGATFIHARGASSHSQMLFDFPIEPQKDVVLMVLETEILDKVSAALEHHFEMHKENTGIQYAYPLSRVVGLYGQEIEHA
ncbi:MAG: hypothetical protein Q4E09_01080 [Eubacteriales bacterium]|nr:hypothetical protein [Eubacteriales bacterium]